MRWQLVTTNMRPGPGHEFGLGWNVGDNFARLGTEAMIRTADPSAEILYINVNAKSEILRPAGILIFAGRPMFWEGCEKSYEWDLLRSWPNARVILFGVGDCYSRPYHPHMESCFLELEHRQIPTITRMGMLYRLKYVVPGVCPSTFLISERSGDRKLCNFMPGGGHYPTMNPLMAEVDLSKLQGSLLNENYEFVAHTANEAEYAESLGWKKIHFFDKVEEYLALYKTTSKYIGNRLHGAVVIAQTAKLAVGIGYDSRLAMVRQAGCRSVLSSQMSSISEMQELPPRQMYIRGFQEKMLQILKGVMR